MTEVNRKMRRLTDRKRKFPRRFYRYQLTQSQSRLFFSSVKIDAFPYTELQIRCPFSPFDLKAAPLSYALLFHPFIHNESPHHPPVLFPSPSQLISPSNPSIPILSPPLSATSPQQQKPPTPRDKTKKNPSQTPRLTASPRMKPKPPRQSKQTAPIQSTRLQHRLIISTPPLQSHLPSPSIQDNSGADIACSRGVTSDGGRDDRARDIDTMFSAFLKRGGPRSCLFPSVIHSLTCIQSSDYAYVELERRLLRLRSGRRREGLGYLLIFTLGVGRGRGGGR